MSFVVSARKYRPQRFDEVVGQSHVSKTLKNALQTDHVAHAFLFCGPRGVGKTTCARILAKVLNCETPTKDMEPCNECSSCASFNGNASFNIHELDAASNNSVEHIRSLVEQVRFQPQQGKFKIYIIDEVHMLSQSAFNAFLKTLEEPPPYAIFILATTEKHKIIPTILSRCQIFDFRRIQVGDIVQHLETICEQEGITAETDALHIMAQKADGALRDALSIFDRIVSYSDKSISYQDVVENLNILDYDYYFKIIDALLQEDLADVLLQFNHILSKGFEPEIFVNGLSDHLRNLLVCKDKATLQLLEVGENIRKRYEAQAGIAPTSFLLTALHLANDCDVNFKMARNKRLHAEVAIMKMCYINQAIHQHQMGLGAAVPAEKKTAEVIKSPAEPVQQKTEHPAKEEKDTPVEHPAKEEPTPPVAHPEKEKETPPETLSPASHNSDNEKPSLKKTGLLKDSLSLGSLKDIEAEIEAAQPEEDQTHLLTDEHLKAAWQGYTENVESPSAKGLLSSAVIRIEETTIRVKTSGTHQAEAIKKDKDLLEHLKQVLKHSKLLMDVQIDKSLQPKKPEIEKPLSDKEKYQKLLEKNPALGEFQKRFDLRLDKN
ncbi:MAG: DNA polymerase III subunit gamma/tau [Bacteroidota bacterium]